MRVKLLLVLFSIFLVLVVLVFGVTSSGAWFADSARSEIGIITAGSLDLEVVKDPDEQAGLTPGSDYLPIGSFCNRNKGTTDLKYRGLFVSDNLPEQNLIPYVTMKVEIKRSGEWIEEQVIAGAPTDDAHALIRYFSFPDQEPEAEHQYIIEGVLNPGQETCYKLSAKIEGAVPQELRQSRLDFQLHLRATQVVNPGW